MRYFCLFSVLSICGGGIASAQSKNGRVSVIPVDTTATTLSRAMRTTPQRVASLFPKLTKGEFESTDAFRQRAKAQIKGAVYAVDISQSVPCFQCITYDADKQLISVEFLTSEREYNLAPMSLVVALTSEDVGTYTAQNAFGASVKVFKSEGIEYVLTPSTGKPFSRDGRQSVTTTMAPDSASMIKPSLRPFVVFRPAMDSLGVIAGEEDDRKFPTRDLPYDESIHRHFINVDYVALWLVDQRSGLVVRRFALYGG